MINLFDSNGYVNMPYLYNRPYFLQLIVGGRGTGKTYGAFKLALENSIKFIYMRRTQTIVDILSTPERSPIKTVCRDLKLPIRPFSIDKYTTGFYPYTTDDAGKTVIDGDCAGYMAALSTFSNLRGFDASDVELIIYDEFIQEKHEKRMKGEYEALLNAYETVNRNRELQGKPATKLLCLSNANDIANPIFVGLDIVNRAVKMKNKGVNVYENPQRGIGVYFTDGSPVSAAKAETALYKLTAGSDFAEMSLDNDFSHDRSSTLIHTRNLKELQPVVAIGELCIYKIKGTSFIYASTHISGNPETYLFTSSDARRFKHRYAWITIAYLNRQIECENYLAETLLTKVLFEM